MAFGTGTHETTQLCLQAIQENYEPGNSFLDVGTGTGILAIAAAKINLKSEISNLKLFACDTDVDSVSIARDNALLNDVGELIDFSVGSINGDTPSFDLVCANLTLDSIDPILPSLLKKATKTLVLSGILVEQESGIADALARLDHKGQEISRAGEWICVVVKKS
jgi:ribosomal protein L11 methyltransferase